VIFPVSVSLTSEWPSYTRSSALQNSVSTCLQQVDCQLSGAGSAAEIVALAIIAVLFWSPPARVHTEFRRHSSARDGASSGEASGLAQGC
jgi:hypothetical protein